MNYVKSRFIHQYTKPNEETIALLHAVRLSILHVDQELVSFLNQFEQPTLPEEAFAATADAEACKDVFASMVELGMLVPEGTDEIQAWHDRREASIDRHGAGRVASIRILLTEQCNLRCTYCFIDHKATYMEVDTLHAVLDKLIESSDGKYVSVQYFGGEPLLKFDLIQEGVRYMEEAQKQGRIGKVTYNLTTNATIFNDEIASFLAKYKFTISVSLDGEKEINDTNRLYIGGQGSYDKALEGLKTFKKHGCHVGILLTPTPLNVHNIAEFFEYAVNELGVHSFAINTPQPSPIGWGVDGAEYAKQMILCHQFSQACGVPFHSTLDKVLISVVSRQGVLSSCFNPQGDRCASVTVAGKISPCIVSWDQEFLQPLEMLNQPEMFLTESYVPQPRNCLDCPALNMCGGPCHLENLFMNKGGVWDDNRCQFFAKAAEWAVWNVDSIVENPEKTFHAEDRSLTPW